MDGNVEAAIADFEQSNAPRVWASVEKQKLIAQMRSRSVRGLAYRASTILL